MLICVCNNVNTEKFTQSAKKHKCINKVCKETKAGTKCGKCKPFAKNLFEELQENNKTVHI